MAAVLYGVGVRLDDQPLLLFEWRGIEIGHCMDVAISNKAELVPANEVTFHIHVTAGHFQVKNQKKYVDIVSPFC